MRTRRTRSDSYLEGRRGALRERTPAAAGADRAVTQATLPNDALRFRDAAIPVTVQGFTITDPTLPDNPIVYASPGFVRLTGYDVAEVIGRNSRFLRGADTDPADVERLQQAIRDGRSYTVVLRNYRKNGTPFWNEISISPIRDAAGKLINYVGVSTDVTCRRNWEDRYRESRVMDVVGQISIGVAHDVSNLLTIVTAYSDLLRQSRSIGQVENKTLIKVVKAAEQAASLTRRLVGIGLNQRLPAGVINVNTIVRDVVVVLRHMIHNSCDISAKLCPGLNPVMAAPGQISQILFELALNARDAMPMGGKLVFETKNVTLPHNEKLSNSGSAAGEYVMLSVTDTGIGMSPEAMRCVLEPAWTVPNPDSKAGLGLAVVCSVVAHLNGRTEFASEPGRDTTAKVYLPRAAAPQSE